jgi:hypothetical protein
MLRVQAATGSCNSHHINRVEGQIEGLLAALTGERPAIGRANSEILRAASIPFTLDGEFVIYDDAWLAKMGFECADDGDLSHPKFKRNW